jgi:hypothetical protein
MIKYCDHNNGQLPVLTLNLLTSTIVAPPINASKWQMGFNSAFKGLKFGVSWPADSQSASQKRLFCGTNKHLSRS